jgi:hypothetical protein
MPVDSPLGPAPILDWDSRKAAADRISTEHPERACKVHPELPPDDRGTPMAKRLEEVAASTTDFDARLEEARKIGTSISESEMKKSSPVPRATKSEPDTLEQVRNQIAKETADLAERQRKAAQIRDQYIKGEIDKC